MDVDPSAPSLSLSPDLRAEVETYSGPLAPDATRLSILTSHLSALPDHIARAVGTALSPRQRTAIPTIKHRRHVWATATPPPVSLSAGEGRRRWPLLWERMGGDPRVALPGHETSVAQAEAAKWAEEGFMPGHKRHVGHLGTLLAEEEEVGEWEEARRNRARERRLDEVGEEFDEESDEESVDREVLSAGTGDGDQESAKSRFERALLELFLDGLDTLDYDVVDFTPADDRIAEQDAEEAWFDDEAPSAAGGVSGNGVDLGDKVMENGQGEYDY
ncbi:hypothetical protein CspeluHIS016_0405550 [Cutaneotrichosporon spelunceum]|uniref:CCD97-like C-terminal domain-containing protein n=1 Tax=Cutaneotrichosporon spelunceum TaxID=1672016 RepID=A0AAD3TW82_9TREE|nr:hypothetical protein CspeluHIS016_0405550 [Cutaneotrichosporon spelunceum]